MVYRSNLNVKVVGAENSRKHWDETIKVQNIENKKPFKSLGWW